MSEDPTNPCPYWRLQARAHKAVLHALRRSTLTRGQCAEGPDDCKGRIEAHHEDYHRPLEVIWLCVRHHRRLKASTNAEPAASLGRATTGSDNNGG